VNLVNEEFMKQHQKAHGIFLPYGISDHSPTVLLIQDGYCQKIKAFRLIKKLKNLKKPLRKLSWSQGNVHDRVNILKDELKKCQEAVDKNPFDKDVKIKAAQVLCDYMEASKDDLSLFIKKLRFNG
nr:hypothetical protein [Tanacetum cinerariifolium]